MKRIKKRIKQVSLITVILFLFQLFSPVFYEKLQAEIYMSVSGKVIDGDNSQGVRGVKILLFDEKNAYPFSQNITDNNGCFTFDMIPPGNYSMYAYAFGDYALDYISKMVTVKRGKNVTGINFTLEKSGNISGTAYQSDGITPLSNTVVMAKSSDSFGRAVTDSNGNYTIMNLKKGNLYIIGVIPDKYTVASEENVVVIPGQTTKVNLILSNCTTTISGTVKSSKDGNNIQGAYILIYGESDRGIDITNSSGQYTVKGFSEGKYDIIIAAKGYKPFQKSGIVISPGQHTVINFDLEPAEQKSSGIRRYEDKKSKLGVNISPNMKDNDVEKNKKIGYLILKNTFFISNAYAQTTSEQEQCRICLDDPQLSQYNNAIAARSGCINVCFYDMIIRCVALTIACGAIGIACWIALGTPLAFRLCLEAGGCTAEAIVCWVGNIMYCWEVTCPPVPCPSG